MILTWLILAFSAKINDNLRGSIVQGVEIISVLLVQTSISESINATETVHQFSKN